MEKRHQRGLPFDDGIKSSLILVVCYKEKEPADLKFLDKTFSDWWIGHDDSVLWPPRFRHYTVWFSVEQCKRYGLLNQRPIHFWFIGSNN